MMKTEEQEVGEVGSDLSVREFMHAGTVGLASGQLVTASLSRNPRGSGCLCIHAPARAA